MPKCINGYCLSWNLGIANGTIHYTVVTSCCCTCGRNLIFLHCICCCMPERRHFGLCQKHLTTFWTMLAFCQTFFCTSCRHCLVYNYLVIASIPFPLDINVYISVNTSLFQRCQHNFSGKIAVKIISFNLKSFFFKLRYRVWNIPFHIWITIVWMNCDNKVIYVWLVCSINRVATCNKCHHKDNQNNRQCYSVLFHALLLCACRRACKYLDLFRDILTYIYIYVNIRKFTATIRATKKKSVGTTGRVDVPPSCICHWLLHQMHCSAVCHFEYKKTWNLRFRCIWWGQQDS